MKRFVEQILEVLIVIPASVEKKTPPKLSTILIHWTELCRIATSGKKALTLCEADLHVVFGLTYEMIDKKL